MKIIDISMDIDEDMIYYPENPQPEIEKYREIPEDSTTESKICIGSHTGSHVDAPAHVFQNGEKVSDLELENFYGNCQVLDLSDSGRKIDRETLKKKEITEEIVLLKTENSEKGYEQFREDFAYLSVSGVEYLVEKDVNTVGIDYLSLVEFDGGNQAEKAHKKANKDMTVIEGLNLSKAEEKSYKFSGFPLNVGTDGAPLRPVLIQEDETEYDKKSER